MDIRNAAKYGVLSPYMMAWVIATGLLLVCLFIFGEMFNDAIMSYLIIATGGMGLLFFFLTVFSASSNARDLQARYGLPDTLPEKAPADVTTLIQQLEAIGFEQGGIMTFGPLRLSRADGQLFEAFLYEYVLFEPDERVIAKITRRNTVPDWSVRFVSYWSDNRVLITENQPETDYDSGLVRYQTTDKDTDIETAFAMHRDTMQQIRAEKGRPIQLHLIEDVIQIGNAKRARDTGAQIVARTDAAGCLAIQVMAYIGLMAGILLFQNEIEAVLQVILS